VPSLPTGEERRRLLLRYADVVASLGGNYRTGPDVNTTSADMDLIGERTASQPSVSTPPEQVEVRLLALGEPLSEIYERAEREGITTEAAAVQLALTRLR
jgi:hypothetical protein